MLPLPQPYSVLKEYEPPAHEQTYFALSVEMKILVVWVLAKEDYFKMWESHPKYSSA